MGTNRIEKILDGCAILEHCRGVEGSEAKSLFYYSAAKDEWKQVWVTSTATRVAGLKEKTLIAGSSFLPRRDRLHAMDNRG